MEITCIALIKYVLDCPALNNAANAPGNNSVIRIPKIIRPMVYRRPYLIPSRILFLLPIPYANAMIGVIASRKPNARNRANCCTL